MHLRFAPCYISQPTAGEASRTGKGRARTQAGSHRRLLEASPELKSLLFVGGVCARETCRGPRSLSAQGPREQGTFRCGAIITPRGHKNQTAGWRLAATKTESSRVRSCCPRDREKRKKKRKREGFLVYTVFCFYRRSDSCEEDKYLSACAAAVRTHSSCWVSMLHSSSSSILRRAARKVVCLLLARPSSSYQNAVGRRGMAELTNTILQRSNPHATGAETSPITTSQTKGAPSTTSLPTASTPSPKGTREDKTRGGRGRVPFDERAVTGGGFFVAGAWSKAGVCSCFNIRHRHLLGKHGVVFDMGVCPSEVLHVQHVFVSHGHLDHCGAIVSHARLRALSQGAPAKYYMGAELAAGMEKVRKAFEDVEGASIAMDIVAVEPEDCIDLGQGCFVRPFLVQHRVNALGFALLRRKAEGLKPEYRELNGKAIGALKKQGVDVSLSQERVEVVYTGDTVMDGLVSQPMVWEARLLIMEVTYLDGDGRAAAKNFHIHVQDVLDNIDKLEGVERLVVAHVSERHGSHRNILRLLAAALPPTLTNKVSIALGEFGAPQHLSFLEDYVPGELSPQRFSRQDSQGREAEGGAGEGGGKGNADAKAI